MELNFHVNGAERKRLVQTISNWLGVPAKYCGAPTFNYEVDYFTIDRNGSLSFDDRADSEVIERLLEHIYDEGFDIDQSHTDAEDRPLGEHTEFEQWITHHTWIRRAPLQIFVHEIAHNLLLKPLALICHIMRYSQPRGKCACLHDIVGIFLFR